MKLESYSLRHRY